MSAPRCYQGVTYAFVLLVLLIGPRIGQAAPVGLPDGSAIENVDFERHVMGLLGRMGCSAGACHGSFQGKGGFYLSLFGYSAEKDYHALTRDGMGRRVNLLDPEQSLILLKATGSVNHGGGRRFDRDSYQYRVLREWIAQGARWEPGSGTIRRVEAEPKQQLFSKPGESKLLQVLVEYADGSRAGMGFFADFRITDDYVAEMPTPGTVRGLRPGDTTAVIAYRGQVVTTRIMVPVPLEPNFAYPATPAVNYIDREVFAKLRQLNIVPSDLSSDSEFLRRLYIDTIGGLPSPEDVRAFLADKDPEKRTKKIEELLNHSLHSALWATKFSDITGNNVDVMEQPAGSRTKRSKMWHDWFRKRIADNVPYDQIVRGVLTATSRDGRPAEDWAKNAVEIEQAAAQGFDSPYAERPSLDLFWRRLNFPVEQMAEHTAAAFLGVRIECAQCHKHPFDRWTQLDYRQYANIFAQVKLGTPADSKTAIAKANEDLKKLGTGKNKQVPVLREVYTDNAQLRRLAHPDTNQPVNPKALGGPELDYQGDARQALFNWLVGPDNPYFARIFVNRVWAHYFGVGLVEPVDSFSAANPPSNEKLLDALAKDFMAHKYDIRHLERTVMQSRTYQLSARLNATNVHDKNNYSRSYVRRMMAEVVVDVLNSALGVAENFGPDLPPGIKAVEIAQNRVQSPTLTYIFRIFGRPPRGTTCDCERASEPALPQTLYLMTDPNLLAKINNGRLKTLLASNKTEADIVEELFLATLCRLPTEEEKQGSIEHVQKKGRQTGLVDIVWSLINTREFILNH